MYFSHVFKEKIKYIRVEMAVLFSLRQVRSQLHDPFSRHVHATRLQVDK